MKTRQTLIILCVMIWAGWAAGVSAQPAVTDADAEFVYESGGRRDPFWPLVNKGGGIISYDKDLLSSEMALQGIIVGNDGKNIAIINGIIVKEGEMIGLYLVEEIGSGAVTLSREQETVTLTLNKEE